MFSVVLTDVSTNITEKSIGRDHDSSFTSTHLESLETRIYLSCVKSLKKYGQQGLLVFN